MAWERITAMDVVKHIPSPRTTLQLSAKQVIGLNIHQEIRRIQID